LFAFESISELLGIEVDIVRKRLGAISVHDLTTPRYRAHSVAVGQLRARRHRSTTPLARIVERGQ